MSGLRCVECGSDETEIREAIGLVDVVHCTACGTDERLHLWPIHADERPLDLWPA